MSISVLLRLLAVMLMSPPFPESFVPTENVLIDNGCASPYSGELNLIVSALRDIDPPFPETPSSLRAREKELISIITISPL